MTDRHSDHDEGAHDGPADSIPPPHAAGSSLNALMRALDAAEGGTALDRPPKSLPVLAAFQEFIDEERKRSQTRMVVMSAFYLVILLAVVGTGLALGSFVFRHMRDEVKDVRANFHALERESMEAKADLSAKLGRYEGQAEGLRYHLEQQEKVLEQARTALAVRSTDYSGQIDDLKKVIGTLEAQNVSLKKDLTGLRSELPAITQEVAVALNAMQADLRRPAAAVAAPSAPATAPAVAAPAPAAVPAPRAPRYVRDTVRIPIVAPGQQRSANWLVPIPVTAE